MSALGSLIGGLSSPSVPSVYTYQNQAGADQGAYGGSQTLAANGANLATSTSPQLAGFSSNIQNNPYIGQALAGSQQGALYGAGAAGQAYGAGQQLYGAGAAGLPAAQQQLQTAFDPQGALYARTAQQVGDQTNAQLANQGLTQSPYGAGLASNAMNNFNIDWQNNQLQRQQSGVNTYDSFLQSLTGANTGAAGLGAGASSLAGSAANMPYSTYQGQQNNDINAILSQITGTNNANSLTQQSVGDFLNYLTGANQATQTALTAQQQQYGQNQQMGEAAANSLAGGLEGFFG